MPIIDWPRTLREVDGKRVLQTNDDTISLEDAACGCKGLMVIEGYSRPSAWRFLR